MQNQDNPGTRDKCEKAGDDPTPAHHDNLYHTMFSHSNRAIG
jgi:hypothetical protein